MSSLNALNLRAISELPHLTLAQLRAGLSTLLACWVVGVVWFAVRCQNYKPVAALFVGLGWSMGCAIIGLCAVGVHLHRKNQAQAAREGEAMFGLRLLSHDLAGLLTIARDNLELGLEDLHSAESAAVDKGPIEVALPSFDHAQFAMTQGIELLRYVRDSVSQSNRPLTSQSKSSDDRFLVAEAAADAVRAWSRTARRKGVRVTFETGLHPLSTCICGTRALFAYSVIGNLLTNALKYSPVGGKVRVTLRDELADEPALILDVEDQGAGIPDDRIGSLFDSGQNRSTLGTMGEPGSGFGLLLVKACLERYQGDISILRNAQEGVGAHFRIRVPKSEPTRAMVQRYKDAPTQQQQPTNELTRDVRKVS